MKFHELVKRLCWLVVKNEVTFKVSIKIVIQSSLRNLHWRATLLPLFVTSNYVMKIDTHIRVCTAKVDFVIHFMEKFSCLETEQLINPSLYRASTHNVLFLLEILRVV